MKKSRATSSSPPRRRAVPGAAAPAPAAAPADNQTDAFEALLKERAASNEFYVLRLYVTGTTPRSSQAVANIHALCEQHLRGRYDLEVVDIYQQPSEAVNEQIIAAPTLVKRQPEPPKRMVGDFSDPNKVLLGLDLRPRDGQEKAEGPTTWIKL